MALLPWGNSPWGITLTPDHRVLAALMLVAVTLVCAIGALPVRLALGGRRVPDSARTVAQSGGRLGQVMLVAQVATTVVLVFGAGLIVQSLNALLSTDRGFASTRVLSLRLNATAGGQSRLDQTAYYPALVERLAALPGVESVGFARYFGTINARLTPQPVVFAGETEGTAAGVMEYISPDFFTTLGVPLHAGRDVTWRDLPDSPRVAIVSASLARALDPDGDVVGRRVRYGTAAAAEPMEIVGVVGDVSLGNYRETSVPLLYVPAIQVGEARFLTVHLRTSGPPLALAPAAGAAVASLGREQVGLATTLDFLFTNSIVAERMAAVVSTASAVLALVLSCLGLYALLAHAVTRRTREMGIRIAVGATAGQVARLVMGQGAAGGCRACAGRPARDPDGAVGRVAPAWRRGHRSHRARGVCGTDPAHRAGRLVTPRAPGGPNRARRRPARGVSAGATGSVPRGGARSRRAIGGAGSRGGVRSRHAIGGVRSRPPRHAPTLARTAAIEVSKKVSNERTPAQVVTIATRGGPPGTP